jgi:cation:H+ antiporter
VIIFIAALVLAILVISKAGNVFVDSACKIARALGVSQTVIALTLIAFVTSAPEFFTSLIAAGLGNVGISYGNVIGSNIINITPILALAAIFGMARVRGGGVGDGLFMLGAGGLLVAMSLDGVVGLAEGVLLLAVFALFLKFVLRRTAEKGVPNIKKRGRLPKLFALFALGIAGVIVGARLLIFGGAGIAHEALEVAGLSRLEAEAAIGFTVVAIGTSIPELATIVISIRKRLPEISVGTIIGSNVFNTAFIIGGAALAGVARGLPLEVDSQGLFFSNPMMLLSMALLVGFMLGRKKLARRHGVALLGFYVVYLVGLALFYAH